MPFVKGRMPEMLETNISSTKPFYDKVRLGLLPYYYFVAGNQLRVLLAILTNINITGTYLPQSFRQVRQLHGVISTILPNRKQRRISEPFATQAELQSIRYAGDCSVSFLPEMKTG